MTIGIGTQQEGAGDRPLFSLGRMLATPGALDALAAAEASAATYLGRHVRGDWGDLDDEDRQANVLALRCGERLLSAYRLPTGERVWIITEWDRSATTVLLPSDY